MAAIQFSTVSVDGSHLGKIEIPSQKIADWINFLAAPKQQARIVSAQRRRSGLTLYFEGNEQLYTYLDAHINQEQTAA